jgi:FkbM family methyltransferase
MATKPQPPKDYSQNGEEGFLIEYFALNRPKSQQFPQTRYYVEIGAYDGENYSNTKMLQNIGWHGVLIEPNPTLFNRLLANRADDVTVCYEVACVSDTSLEYVDFLIYDEVPYMSGIAPLPSKVIPEHGALHRPYKERLERVKAMTLNKVLESYFEGDPSPIDFISLDTEGTEKAVMKGLDFDLWKPQLLCIENNDPRNEDLTARMQERGYAVATVIGINTFYERVK